jgi:hypothetical protein
MKSSVLPRKKRSVRIPTPEMVFGHEKEAVLAGEPEVDDLAERWGTFSRSEGREEVDESFEQHFGYPLTIFFWFEATSPSYKAANLRLRAVAKAYFEAKTEAERHRVCGDWEEAFLRTLAYLDLLSALWKQLKAQGLAAGLQ